MRVINPDGKQLGVYPIHQALAIAAELGLDLVEINPKADPPVCRIMDFGKFKYEQKKQANIAKKKQKTIDELVAWLEKEAAEPRVYEIG